MRTRDETYFKIAATIEAAQALRPREGTPTCQHALWNVVDWVLQQLARQVNELAGEGEEVQDFLTHVPQQLGLFSLLLSLIEASEASRVPQAMVKPFEDLIGSSIEGIDSFGVLVWYEWGATNYTARVDLARKTKQAIDVICTDVPQGQVAPAIPDCLACVSFPAAHREDVMLHSALAHEFGHVVTEYRNDLPEIIDRFPLSTDMLKSPDASSTQGDIFEHARTNDAKRIRTRWLLELLADAWAVHLVGPAALLALLEWPDQYSTATHPPTRLRYPLMVHALEKAGFIQAGKPAKGCEWLARAHDVVGRRVKSTKSLPTSERGQVLQCVYQAVQPHLQDLVDHVYGGDSEPYTVATWGAAGNELCDRILNYVPPNSVRSDMGDEQPADLPSILNAGWAVYETEADWNRFCGGLEATELNEHYEARLKLNRLLLKAIELAQLMRHWEEDNATGG